LSRPHTDFGSAAIEQIIVTGLHEYLEGPGTIEELDVGVRVAMS
jgi:hypothetical protein